MHLTRRTMMATMASCTLLPPIIPAAITPAQAAEPDFPVPKVLPLDHTDYAEARRKFTTHLLQKGPAPDDQRPLGTPPEARRITYPGGPDGSIQLVAWISPYEETGKPKPAVLFLHGGNATGDGHWLLMKPYVEAGFVVMLPSFRGENGQQGYFPASTTRRRMRWRQPPTSKTCPASTGSASSLPATAMAARSRFWPAWTEIPRRRADFGRRQRMALLHPLGTGYPLRPHRPEGIPDALLGLFRPEPQMPDLPSARLGRAPLR